MTSTANAVRFSDEAAETVEGTSLWQDAWKRLKKNRMAVASAGVLAVVILFCVVGPWLVGYGFEEQDLAYGAQGASWGHWFGTDLHGRDLLVRSMYGGRISLLVGLCATAVSLTIGVAYGAVSGYFGGRLDAAMMRAVDVLYTIPFMFVVILFLVLFGRSMVMLFVALGAVSWLTMARIVRGQVLSLKQSEFVEAARASGVGHGGIIFRHLVPNALGPIIIYTTLTIPRVMLEEAFLSYLGLGVQPPMASWGLLVSDGANAMTFFPHMLLFPGAILTVTLFALNFLGDGLRDALDPRMRT
ncbi:ABC transporter permease [Vulgatibacter incomptus]|uniref:Oligopeptide transport system permease protein OppC n=1 Tax=Vulgatibacter incomptus TaxID=1391653 RepID=A0A0K1PAA8_9BACT|nr:ABC transporter permease [Vulgatibacter incomptus]AKU90437.1 Oligopeptide transport system permease protein OppC [Vulgatibacter incomptus]